MFDRAVDVLSAHTPVQPIVTQAEHTITPSGRRLSHRLAGRVMSRLSDRRTHCITPTLRGSHPASRDGIIRISLSSFAQSCDR